MVRLIAFLKRLKIPELLGLLLAAPLFIVLMLFKTFQILRDERERVRREKVGLKSEDLLQEASRMGEVSSEIEQRIRDLESDRDGAVTGDDLKDFFNGRKK